MFVAMGDRPGVIKNGKKDRQNLKGTGLNVV